MSRKAADQRYFETYGPGGSRSYDESWREFTFEPSDVLPLYKALFDSKPKTLLDLGAANGALVAAFLRRGVEAMGVENSRYIHKKITDPDLKKRILLGDAQSLIATLPTAQFDIVIDCAAQYLPRKNLRAYLKHLNRICARMCCLLTHFKETPDEHPHQGMTIFEDKKWWKTKLTEAGFKHIPGGEGFFYAKRR